MILQRRKYKTEMVGIEIHPGNKSNQKPIDEQVQDEIVKDLEQEYVQQTQQTSTLIFLMCFLAGLSSVVFQFFHEFQSYFRFYPTYVASLHCYAGFVVKSLIKTAKDKEIRNNVGESSSFTSMHNFTGTIIVGFGIVVAILPMLAHMLQKPIDYWVLILGGSNIYTLVTVLYMKMDFMSTSAALKDLKDSKYKHKSL